MPGVIVPNRLVPYEPPLIFLAGPILGAPKWHEQAIEYIHSTMPEITIAVPIREHENIKNVIAGKNAFERQRPWEHYHMDKAGREGCVLFWFPERVDYTVEKDYGKISSFELGKAIERRKANSTYDFCIGTDGEFSEFRTMEWDVHEDLPEIEIYTTLEETCNQAMWHAITHPAERFILR